MSKSEKREVVRTLARDYARELTSGRALEEKGAVVSAAFAYGSARMAQNCIRLLKSL